MKKYQPVKQSWLQRNVAEEPIDYAIESVREGVPRSLIVEGLTSDYRGLTAPQAEALLNDLYAAHGGEFRNKKRSGLITGTAMLVIGIGLTLFVYSGMERSGGIGSFPKKLIILPAGCALLGLLMILAVLVGAHKDPDFDA
ncbi:MAG: hypothetical protein EOO11_13080 [Chitinophagaceae bacterium]|nr:MAG: hypothetical protein EOO11_13080 [Chitinophagaceae bacterium]